MALPYVLKEATRRAASAIVVEVGKAPMAITPSGPWVLGNPQSEREIFDSLERLLGPEDLVELAVGQTVRFEHVVEGVHWTLLAESSGEGLVVRGTCGLEDADPRTSPTERTSDHEDRMATSEWPTPDHGDPSIRDVVGSSDASSAALPELVIPDLDRSLDEDEPMFARSILEPGTLGLAYGRSVAERLFAGQETLVVNAATDLDQAAEAWSESTVIILRVEDPSAYLGWVLRRLEEGARVAVETRVKTLEGARRVLMGVTCSDRAERWLEHHPLVWLESEDDR